MNCATTNQIRHPESETLPSQSTSECRCKVDRYIRDYESVKVVRKATADIDQISQITRLSKRVISQYLDLIPEDQLKTMDANLAKKEQIR